MDTKYIRNGYQFLVFSNNFQHRDLAISVVGHGKIFHSAGFVKFTPEPLQANCFGKSVSLSCSPRRDDNESILKCLEFTTGHTRYARVQDKLVIFSPHFEFEHVAHSLDAKEYTCGTFAIVDAKVVASNPADESLIQKLLFKVRKMKASFEAFFNNI